ncbi:acyl-CoA N-acyltransferase [Athelia psychrophila]|uniref:Acyl-CoA N-acyltransferase n=1 Tax=Athelia psychrophila TaxID=1759441 RepID=A0A166BH54_9AGAM|nr:acyl-CoA N-acyltransferase [Fibularhizoctonia sp. CBS 109695]
MLETDRLELHNVGDKESYIDDIVALWTNSIVQISYEGNQSLRDKAKVKETIKEHCEKDFHAVLVLKKTGAFIGECSIHVLPGTSRNGNFAIAILPEHWGKGYATEASAFAVNHGFRWMALHRLSIDVYATNTAAVKLYTGLGFKQEGHRKEMWWHNGEWIDDYQLGLLDKEYWAQKSASS